MDNLIKYIPAENKREKRLRLMQEKRFGNPAETPAGDSAKTGNYDGKDSADREDIQERSR
jgi:hypothetical protein